MIQKINKRLNPIQLSTAIRIPDLISNADFKFRI